jgi:SAM-dependent methyltransferase
MKREITSRWITPNDLKRSATASMLGDLMRALQPMASLECESLLDIGCGFGGLARFMAETLGARDVHGIDIDPKALAEAKEKNVTTHHLNMGEDPLPFADGSFDVVTSFGMLDYLSFFDRTLREIRRVLRPGGHALISLPNLASWHNRLALLLGYQPRDVEVSSELLVGVHPWYARDGSTTGHIHAVTTSAFCALMSHHGFRSVRVTAGRPRGRKKNLALIALDRVFTRRVSLARRFFYLGIKSQGLG